jgi:hypothetical protein
MTKWKSTGPSLREQPTTQRTDFMCCFLREERRAPSLALVILERISVATDTFSGIALGTTDEAPILKAGLREPIGRLCSVAQRRPDHVLILSCATSYRTCCRPILSRCNHSRRLRRQLPSLCCCECSREERPVLDWPCLRKTLGCRLRSCLRE